MKVPLSTLRHYLEEDMPFGDITSEAVVPGIHCTARVVAREDGVIAGLEEAEDLLSSQGLTIHLLTKDGSRVTEGTSLMEIAGPATLILASERTVLNILGRMSGIATLTRTLVDRVREVNADCRIACTRKTAPGLRLLDKKAVVLGGGESHRYSLSDMILIKDNHLALVSLEEAVRRAKAQGLFRKIEVEVTTSSMAEKAARTGVQVVMLDNMTPLNVAETLENLDKKGLRKGLIIEVSGGITRENIHQYAALGVDVISVGNITHSAPSLNVNLEIVGKE